MRREWDGNGHKMTMQDWVSCVDSEGFIDYDGFMVYYDEDTNEEWLPDEVDIWGLYPSDYLEGKVDSNVKHIIWFNQ